MLSAGALTNGQASCLETKTRHYPYPLWEPARSIFPRRQTRILLQEGEKKRILFKTMDMTSYINQPIPHPFFSPQESRSKPTHLQHSTMATMFNLLRLCFFPLLITLSLSNVPALSEKCNPADKKALLQIKQDITNQSPTLLSSWNPATDCCNNTWDGVSCDPDTNRVNDLSLSQLNSDTPFQLPSSIGNLPYLNFLFIYTIPNLIGPIPPTIAKLTNLHYLTISHTNVSGTIPDFWPQLKSLVTVDFSYNNLYGKIPASLSVLTTLVGITFDGNRLTGTIPDSFGSLTTNFTALTLSRNLLTGKIPASLAKLNLAFVDLSRNKLEGDASVLFGSNKETQKIILSRNLLSFDLGKVGLSKNLEAIDVRNNRIYGNLPEGLTALKFLHKLNVSYNSLCGEIPQGGNLQRFDSYSYAHNKCLCGSPLPSCKVA